MYNRIFEKLTVCGCGVKPQIAIERRAGQSRYGIVCEHCGFEVRAETVENAAEWWNRCNAVPEVRGNPYHDPKTGRFTGPGGIGGTVLNVDKGQKGKDVYAVGNEMFDKDWDDFFGLTSSETDDIIIDNTPLSGTRRLAKHDIDDCYNTTNPNYGKGQGYSNNCQRCVSAYEARRRGYDVEASERPLEGSDELSYTYSANGWPSVYKDGAANLKKIGARTAAKTKNKIESEMQSYGDGARAIIRVQWKGRNKGGHVFIAEQVNGKTQFIDPQSGKRDASSHFKARKIKPRKTCILRIDNLEFTDNIKKCIK